jgi:hypothetical protein
MSRRLLVPVVFGGDADTARLRALDAAGFSAAIPAFLHYDLEDSHSVLDALFSKHGLVSMVAGSLASAVPARTAWEAIERGRIGTRSCAVVALDALAAEGGLSVPLRPVQRVVAATAERDRAYWDLRVRFRRAPSMLEVFPREPALRQAADNGALEFEQTARLLEVLLAPVPTWHTLGERSSVLASG